MVLRAIEVELVHLGDQGERVAQGALEVQEAWAGQR